MTEHLWDNSGYTISDAGPISAGFELGVSWQCVATGAVTRLGWYRVHVGSVAPDTLNLWDHGWGAALARKITPNDSGAVGWQWTDLDLPVPTYIGRRYVVSYHAGNGFHLANFGGGNVLPPTAHLLHGPSGRDVAQSVSTVFPSGHDSTQGPVVDVEWELQQPSGELDAQQTALVIDQKLAAWFTSTNDNTHQSELPWLTYGQANGANANAQNAHVTAQQVQASVDDPATGLGAIKGVVDAINTKVVGLSNRLTQAIVDTVVGASQAYVDWIGTTINDVTRGWEQFVNQFRAATGGGGFGLPDPGAGWTLVDETDFVEELAWPVGADVYFVSFSQTPPRTPGIDVAGVLWQPRLAWWCELNTGFATERRYIDFPVSLLQSPTGRMFGLLLNGGKDTAGHVQAWTKD